MLFVSSISTHVSLSYNRINLNRPGGLGLFDLIVRFFYRKFRSLTFFQAILKPCFIPPSQFRLHYPTRLLKYQDCLTFSTIQIIHLAQCTRWCDAILRLLIEGTQNQSPQPDAEDQSTSCHKSLPRDIVSWGCIFFCRHNRLRCTCGITHPFTWLMALVVTPTLKIKCIFIDALLRFVTSLIILRVKIVRRPS